MTLGNEQIVADYRSLIQGKRVALLTNDSGVDSALVLTSELLRRSAGTKLVALFCPEHGLHADAPDGVPVPSGTDEATGLPVHSLFGDDLSPNGNALNDVDVLLYDIQDVGVRYYTFISTMTYAMEACAGIGLPFIVLDRPAPIDGVSLEGNILEPAYSSLVGKHPVPIRYGMTCGEFALYANTEFDIGADLKVVPMIGWDRTSYFDKTGLAWVPPSPSMPSLDTAIVYSGTCLVEGTELSEGRGTCKPFEQIGAPFIDAIRLAALLNDLGMPGVLFRPTSFIPSTDKFVGERCRGVQVHVTDRKRFQSVRTGLELIAAVRRLFPGDFLWRASHFDHLAGTDRVRETIEGGGSVRDMISQWEPGLLDFGRRRQQYLLYGRGRNAECTRTVCS